MTKAYLYLEDGTLYEGVSVGSEGTSFGELIFNTSLVGYEEILTDPSNNGKVVLMTYPIIGGYGTNKNDVESDKVWARGFIIRELCDLASNWQNDLPLGDFLKKNNVVAISDIDTRAITKKIRDNGSMPCVISTEFSNINDLSVKLYEYKKSNHSFVKETVSGNSYIVNENGKYNIVLIDMGVKNSVINDLVSRDCKVTVLPYDESAQKIMELSPDGVFFSNGCGDPSEIPEAVELVKSLFGKTAVCGVDLGHLVIGKALGFDVYKMKFGHHSANQPVLDTVNNRVFITSQNHNFALKESEIPNVEITHLNINDDTVEGIASKSMKIKSFQYISASNPAKNDNVNVYDEFIKLING